MSNELSKKVGCNLIKVAFHPKFSLILQAVRNSEWSGKQKGNYTIVDETYQDFQAWKCVVHEKKMKNCFVAFHFFAWEEEQSYLKTAKNMWSWLVSKSVIQAQMVDVPKKVLKSAKIREFLQSRGFLCSICMPLTRWRKCKSTHALKLHFSDIWGICVTKKNIYKNKKKKNSENSS